MSRGTRFPVILAASLLLGMLPGCGPTSDHPATAPVRGKVTYRGRPVPKGMITFVSDNGEAASAMIEPEGSYVLGTFGPADGAVHGRHKVGIIADDGDPSLLPGAPGYRTPKVLVPKKYNNPETSGLSADVTKDGRAIDFDLK